MKVYGVIPIVRGAGGKNLLTYFGPDSISLGSLVVIPLRNKNISAIVVEKHDVSKLKSSLRASNFKLRKITSVRLKHFLPELFLKAVKQMAQNYASPVPSVLGTLVPKRVLENYSKIPNKKENPLVSSGEKFIIQEEDGERMAHYKSFIREEFAKKTSVFFCLPTIEDINRVRKILEHGIEQYTTIFHSNLSKKEFIKNCSKIQDLKHPVLIIGTVPFLSLARPDVATIVLDRENSRGYKTMARPLIDLRKFAEFFAKERKAKFVVGDSFLSIETLWRKHNDEFLELSSVKFRSLSSAEGVVIDMKKDKDSREKEFKVLSPELEELIEFNHNKKQYLFIFSARKGLSPSTVCGDCGKIVTCKNCKAVLVLYSGKGKDKDNFFLCHRCGEKRSALEKCENCDGWRLNTLGIGIEKVEAEIKKKFPNISIFRIDKESAKNSKKATEIVEKFTTTPGSILLGTEMALLLLNSPIENTAVASLDSFFSLPDFRINEKIFYILLKLRNLSKNIFLIQTRNIENQLFEKVLGNNLIEFYRKEIEDREKFGYPPFSVFVKISVQGKREVVEKQVESIQKLFAEEDLSTFTGFSSGTKRYFIIHILLKFKPEVWPKENAVQKLLSLPLSVKVQVDPESLL